METQCIQVIPKDIYRKRSKQQAPATPKFFECCVSHSAPTAPKCIPFILVSYILAHSPAPWLFL